MDRITPRHVFESRIRIRVHRDSRDLVTEGWARDLSETGVSAFVAQGLNVGEFVTLEIPAAPSSRLSIPAQVARCLGTQYGFRFTALSPDQRVAIQHAINHRPEIPIPGAKPVAKLREPHQGEASLSPADQDAKRISDNAFADRAHMLIKRGYTPKVAVDLVLHEMESEYGSTSRAMARARVDAEDFLMKVRRGVI